MTASTVATLEQIKMAMAETNRRFNDEVFGNRNFDALDQIYTTGARILPPGGQLTSGRAAIKKFWSDLVTGANAKSAVLTSIDVMLSGDGAIEIGSAVLTIAPSGQAESRIEVKYVVYWREEDGLWKWHVDIWNANS